MKKILIVSRGIAGFGGLEAVLKSFIQNVNISDKIKVKLIILGRNGDEQWCKDLDYQVIKLSKKFRKLNIIYNLVKLFIKEKPDFIVSVDSKLLSDINKANKLLQSAAKIFYWPHGSLAFYAGNTDKEKKNFISSMKSLDECLAISSGIKEQFIRLGIEESKVHLIYNPIVMRQEAISKSKNANQFIYIGRLQFEQQKRIKDLIDAFSMIDEDYALKIIGDGEDRQKIVDYLKHKGLDNKITLTQTWVSDPWAIVTEVDALILATAFEGLPMVLGEALSRGIPCISTNCETGPSDFIQEGVNGYLYEPHNIHELKEKILNIMNGKLLYTPEQLKKSIDKMYEHSYYQRIIKLFG